MPDGNRDPRLCRHFVARCRHALSSRPEIVHTWSIDADEDHCFLAIQGQGAPGFDLTVEVWPDTINLTAEGYHSHHDLQEPMEDFVAEFLGFLRDLLSPAMRIREQLAGGSPYRWHLENFENGQWIAEASTGLLFWNWFGRRGERVYMNTHLPVRENHLVP